jgi:hypothetical protein
VKKYRNIHVAINELIITHFDEYVENIYPPDIEPNTNPRYTKEPIVPNSIFDKFLASFNSFVPAGIAP